MTVRDSGIKALKKIYDQSRYYSRTSMVKHATKKAREHRRKQQAKARKAAPVVVAKRGKSGASTSRSAGKFKKGAAKNTIIDKFMRKGAVCAWELGGVLKDSAAPFSQSWIVGHANYTVDGLRAAIALAITRMVAAHLGRHIISWDRVVKGNATGNETFQLNYLGGMYASTTSFASVTLNAGVGQWLDLAKFFYDRLVLAKASEIWTSILVTDSVNTSGSMFPLEIDLTRARVEFFSKSSLKLQNRTIDSSGNVEADDVDNVPLYGKAYYGSGNYNAARIGGDGTVAVIGPGGSTISYQTSTVLGASLDRYWVPLMAVKNAAGTALAEPQPRTFYVRPTKVAAAKLDPGEIKTSVLEHSAKMSMRSLLAKLQKFDVVSTLGANLQSADTPITDFGKNQFFHFEKMLQAVATDATAGNMIRLAYEQDVKIGAIFYAPKKTGYPLMRYDQKPV